MLHMAGPRTGAPADLLGYCPDYSSKDLISKAFITATSASCVNPYDGSASVTLINSIPEYRMATTVDELTVTYEEDGIETVKELDKKVLTKGAWSTIIYRYQDWNRAKAEYGPDKYTIRRYQKRNGEYQQKSKFNISSKEQAEKVIEALQEWIK